VQNWEVHTPSCNKTGRIGWNQRYLFFIEARGLTGRALEDYTEVCSKGTGPSGCD